MLHSRGTRMTQGRRGAFHIILAHLQDMQARGPPRGYFLQPTKSILAMVLGNVPMADEFF